MAGGGGSNADHWARLGEFVRNARTELDGQGWTQQQLADAIERSVKTVNSLEKGRQTGMHEVTKRRLEKALRWTKGDVDRVLAGLEPRPDWDAWLEASGAPDSLDKDELEALAKAMAGLDRPARRTVIQVVTDVAREINRVAAAALPANVVVGDFPSAPAESGQDELRGAARAGISDAELRESLEPDLNVDPPGPEHGA